MQEQIVEPLPKLQSPAKLLMGNMPVLCVVVEVTADGFRVAVPGIEQYEGDPRITLVTRDAVFPVRLVRQEAHVSGYSYRLRRMERILPPERKQPSGRLRLYTSSCCAAGLISIISGSYFLIPQSSEAFALIRRSLRHDSTGTWSPSVAENDRVPPGIAVDNTLIANDTGDDDSNAHRIRHGELQGVQISMASANRIILDDLQSIELETRRANRESTIASSDRNSGHEVSLSSRLQDGRTGRAQPASRELLSWLNRSAPAGERVSFRLSDAAWVDLQEFEIGLKVFSAEASDEATDSLRRAIHLASTNLGRSKSADSSSHVFAVSSDDATIYFQTTHGQIELVRVLPINQSKVAQQ